MNLRSLAERYIPIVKPRTTNNSPAGVSKRSLRGRRERLRTEPALQRVIRRQRSHNVRSLAGTADTRRVAWNRDRQRVAGLKAVDAGDLPSLKQVLGKTRCISRKR